MRFIFCLYSDNGMLPGMHLAAVRSPRAVGCTNRQSPDKTQTGSEEGVVGNP